MARGGTGPAKKKKSPFHKINLFIHSTAAQNVNGAMNQCPVFVVYAAILCNRLALMSISAIGYWLKYNITITSIMEVTNNSLLE